MHSDNNAAKPPSQAEPQKLLRRIGSTTYEVTVHFSNTETSTMEDRLLRLIGREVEKDARRIHRSA